MHSDPLVSLLERREWWLHVHQDSERFRLTKTPDCGLGFDSWAFHPAVKLVRADLFEELLAADLAMDAGQQAIEEFWEQGEPGFVPNQERVAELAANFYGAVARRAAAIAAMSPTQEPRT